MNGRATILYGMPIILAPIREGRLAVRGRSWAWAWVSAMILAATAREGSLIRRRPIPVLAAVLAVAACSATPQEPPSELKPTEVAVPAPPDGMIVGVVVVGRTPSTDASWMTGGKDVYPRYWHRAGTFGEVLIVREARPLEGTVAATENGMPVLYRSFAMRIPPGEGQFVILGNRRTIPRAGREPRFEPVVQYLGRKAPRSGYEWTTATVDAPMALSRNTDVPPATFEVAPGKARYIGRLGMIVHVTSSSGPQSQDCAIGQLEQFSSKHKQELCVARELFVGSAPDADLAMIRRRFPNLAGVDIDIRPLDVRPGSWPDLAAAARKLEARP